MCLMCDGWTREEVVDLHADMVDRDGWTHVGVAALAPWMYTAGLRWSFDHPELVIAGGGLDDMDWTIHDVVGRIEQGERFDVGRTTTSLGVPFTSVPVHPKNLTGEWLAWWPEIAHACGHGADSLRAVQLLNESASTPRLDRPMTPERFARCSRRGS